MTVSERSERSSQDDATRFPSLDSLRAAHTDLIRRFRASGRTPEMVAEVEQFIRRGAATGALLDTDAERWSAQSQLDYWATQLYQPGYEPPDATLDEFDPELAPELDDSLCPYMGLDAFREANETVFFGRRRLIAELVSELKTSRFLAVLGSSGSGKSSVVRAGLIPELKRGALPGSEEWIYFPPMVPGSHPLVNLARLMLAEADADQADKEADLYRDNGGYLSRTVKDRFKKDVVLIIDQFEEIFTLCTDDAARQCFVENLIALCKAPDAGHRVIITMRSDFETNIARLPALQDLFEKHVVRVTPLTAAELREAIEAPAARIGLKFEEGVVDALLSDTLGEPAALPLLQFTLLKLWERREHNRVTWESYKKLGGGRQALANSADQVYLRLIPEQKVTMRRILLKMVRPGEGLEVTSNRVPRASLYQKAEANDRIDRVLERLIKERLVRRSEGDMAGDEQVEIAHEALVRNWPRLVEWLDEERVTLRQRQRLTAAAEEWQRLDRDPSALWRGVLLDEVRRYDDLNELEKEFVAAGSDAELAERKKLEETASKLRRRAYYLTAALAMALIAVFAAIRLANESMRQAELALASRLASQAQLLMSTGSSKQMTAVLLAIQSMDLSPSVEAAQVLQNNTLAAPLTHLVHEGSIWALAISPDGKYVASASNDSSARVWDAATGEELARMTHEGEVIAVAFSRDNKYVVSGSYDGTARVWDAATGEELARMTHEGEVIAVAFSRDNKDVISGSYDGTVRVWEVATGEELARMTHDGEISAVVFSRDGRYVVLGSYDGTVRVWEVATGKELARMTHDGEISAVVISRDNKYVISGSYDGTVRVWEVATGEELARKTQGGDVTVVAMSPDSAYVASGGCEVWKNKDQATCSQGVALVWNAATGEELTRMKHDDRVTSLVFSIDGNYVVSGSSDGTARLWRATTGKEVAQMTHNGDVSAVAISPDADYVVSSACEEMDQDNICIEGIAQVWEASPRNEVARMTHSGPVLSVAISPDGKYVVSGSNDGTDRLWETTSGREIARSSRDGSVWYVTFNSEGTYVASGGCEVWLNKEGFECSQGASWVWDVGTGQEITRMMYDQWVNYTAFSPDGKYLAVGSDDGTARVWEISTGKELARMTYDGAVWPVAFSPDGRYVLSGSYDGTARVWDAATGDEIARLTHEGRVLFATFSPDGKSVISGGDDGIVRVWETTTGKEIASLIHDSTVSFAVFSPDGKSVVSASDDSTARVWNLSSMKEFTRLTHESRVSYAAFNPDGNYVISGSDDGTARVWELATGNEIARVTHDDRVTIVGFSPNGKYGLSGSYDGTARVWYWQPVNLIISACSRLPRNLTRAEWKQYLGERPYEAVCPNLPIESESIATQ